MEKENRSDDGRYAAQHCSSIIAVGDSCVLQKVQQGTERAFAERGASVGVQQFRRSPEVRRHSKFTVGRSNHDSNFSVLGLRTSVQCMCECLS